MTGSLKAVKPMLKGKHFSLMALVDGTAVQIDSGVRGEIEARLTRELGLKPNTHLAMNNFYLLKRTGTPEFFGAKAIKSKV